jgi:uncharacterized damage-inducible protein DinB
VPTLDIERDTHMDERIAPIWDTVAFGTAQLLKVLDGLTPEQLLERPVGFKNSLAGLAVHLAGANISFAHLIHERQMDDELKSAYLLTGKLNEIQQPEGETFLSLIAKITTSNRILKEALREVNPADTARVLVRPSGYEVTIRWYLTLIAYHQSAHIGQMQMIRQHLS